MWNHRIWVLLSRYVAVHWKGSLSPWKTTWRSDGMRWWVCSSGAPAAGDTGEPAPPPPPPPPPRPRLTAAELPVPRPSQGDAAELPGERALRSLRDLRRPLAGPAQHPAQVAVARQVLGGKVPVRGGVTGRPQGSGTHQPRHPRQGTPWPLKSQGTNSHDFQGGELVKNTGREAGEDVSGHVPAGRERKVARGARELLEEGTSRRALAVPAHPLALRRRGQGWPGCPQGATYSRRRLGSPWKTLALRQPMRLLERSLQGEWRGHQGWGCLTVPAGVPRASPGWSEGWHRHLQPLQLGEAEEGARLDCADQVVLQVPAGRQTRILGCAVGAPSPGDTAQGARAQPCHSRPPKRCQPLLINSSPSHFSLAVSPG